MAGGSLDTVRGVKTRRVLREISRRDGMTLTEIQRFICEMNGLGYDADDGLGRRRYRGKDGRKWRVK